MTAAPRLSAPDPATRRGADPRGRGDVLLGEDWVAPDEAVEPELRFRRGRRGIVSLNRSPLARKIIIFNMMALVILVAGVLLMNPFRDSLVVQREQAIVTEARLVAEVFEARLPQAGADLASLAAAAVAQLEFGAGVEVFVFDAQGQELARAAGRAVPGAPVQGERSTVITDFLNGVWEGVSSLMSGSGSGVPQSDGPALARALLPGAQAGDTAVNTGRDSAGGTVFSVATPVRDATGAVVGVVALTSAAGEIDRLVRNEREQVLQMFVIALLVSIGLSLVLASTIANPLSDLAAAAELGRDRDARRMAPGRVRIPDLTARPDEIGRLSVAMRGMVAALYDRIDANEQFAADVAHEIKNPLASLRSAVGTLRVTKRDDHREKLLDVIEHDVRRLDRLVSDISNASRLDSELVKEEEEEFNLLKTLANLSEFLGNQAGERGVELITDLPPDPIIIRGLEARLAQVFVNLITNAISFCEDGDAVRVWARKRENRVLVVVEDTGPGIPDQALQKVFKRFYSERPPGQFGNHSGLGLAISKQIVEAHGGVIWAENIRPTNADPTSDPLGARFVVGLPV
ncbi:MAG TPA: sensor histidine kinase [Paracoccaceae bacterium]|nr:sensor histidine kinase [Paracoccaceae bacterium]